MDKQQKQKEIDKYEKFMHWLWRQKSITELVLNIGMDGIAKKYVKERVEADSSNEAKAALPLQNVTNSLPDLTLDEADVLAKETDYACYACEDTEEINWGDASAFFIEGYQYAIKKFRQ